MRILISWLGKTDTRIAAEGGKAPEGPIAQAAAAEQYDLLCLLSDEPKKINDAFANWLKKVAPTPVEFFSAKLSSPTNYRDIYDASSGALGELAKRYKGKAEFTFHLSPGTPAMAAVWIILGRAKYPAELIQSSREKGVELANVPFEIAAEFIPDFVRSADEKRRKASGEHAPEDASFGDIIYRSKEVADVVRDATKAALRDLPVLIEGESGTGKELLARAIHNNSQRKGESFIVVNCGAIPSELVESEFFGHKKGAFTGADSDHVGAFKSADGGTIFLDEIGELPLAAQVALLRPLQENEIKRVGDNKIEKVDVRVIAATNRDLISEVADGRFREDLYYRLAIATLKLPPLRERRGDLTLLVDRLLEQVNNDAQDEPGYVHKKISVKAKNLILTHKWPGNVRELLNTLRRVTLFADGGVVSESDMRRAIQPVVKSNALSDQVLGRQITEGIDLQELLDEVSVHYFEKALKETGGNKSKASRLLGFKHYQTFTGWLDKLGMG
jgi:transcriptional regulator with GAF, ATPase, and Fis domain